uniref:PEGA domain-containing protein n=1 Tax=Pyrococcus abyssi TaxID=29292 RepID=A0A5J6XTB4_PYRAY|nr:hypothetical protein [Pyrococcus abyssi]QFN51287.1 hypothetical protein [Pyrococcus abyssi]
MKRFGILLALLVLVSALSVGTSPVRADTFDEKMRVVFTLSESYDVQQALNALNWSDNPHWYDSTTLILLDGKNVIVKSSDMWDLFKEGSQTIDSSNWKANEIASQILQTLIDAGVVSADAHYTKVTAQSKYVDNAKYVYIVHYYIKNSQKREFNVELAYAKLFWRMQAYTNWDHGQTVVNIYDSATEDNTVSREYYYKGTGKPTHTREGELLVNTWQSYINNKTVSVYTEAAAYYTSDSWMRFRLIFFSNKDYSNGIDGIKGNPGVSSSEIIRIQYTPTTYIVHITLKDALTGQPLTGVTVKEGDTVLGTINDGQSLELTKGTHTLIFEKPGYWSVTKEVNVQGDMTLNIEMYPDSAAFKLENFPADISIPENTIYELTFTLSPIDTSATYNTYLSLSGLSDVLEVKKNGQVISPESGRYYLGDISGDTQITIKFKAGSVGTHSFTITITSNDAIASRTYTTVKQVSYEVVPLPFSIQFPQEWQVGKNTVRISESNGDQLTVLLVLKDKDGNEVWSESAVLGPYEARDFQLNVPAEGSYTLEIQYNGKIAQWSITVNPVISLVTKTVQVKKGGEGVVMLHFKNPSDSVLYYTIILEGGFLANQINKTISLAPLSEKDVSIAFAVPSDLQYDAYELNVKVLQGNATVFQDKVAVTITDSVGFSLPIGSGSSNWLLYGIVGLVIIAILVALARR